MPTYEDARRIILNSVAPLGAERVALLESAGRVVAEDIVAPWEIPFCDNSAMDGFAVRSADCRTIPVSLLVTGYIPAGGAVSGGVETGCAMRIMTGAPLPPGCDAVVPVEETEDIDGKVIVREPVKAGQHVRLRGEDVAAGATIISAGRVVRPAEISMMASLGRALVPVHRRPRVAILSTGDELIELGETPAAGKIINSNALSLAAAVREIGGIPVMLGIARDERESHREKMLEGLGCDALITSAGVSEGDRDLVRDVLAELGVRQLFWKVAMKPGGPTAFALKERTPVFSLPGNPVSTLVTFELFVKPALRKMMGERRVIPRLVTGVLQEEMRKKAGKVNFIRVRVEREGGGYLASTAGDQHTGILRTMLGANALAVLPAEATIVPAGSEVELLLQNDVDLLPEN